MTPPWRWASARALCASSSTGHAPACAARSPRSSRCRSSPALSRQRELRRLPSRLVPPAVEQPASRRSLAPSGSLPPPWGRSMRSEATTSQDMPRARAAAAWRRPRRRNATTRPRSGFSAPRSTSARRPRPRTPPAGSPAPSSKPAGRTVRQSLPRTDRQSVPRTDRQVVVRVGHGNRAPATTRPINQGLSTRRAGPTVSSPEPSNRPRPPLTQPALHPARAPVSSRSKAPKPVPVPRPANPTRIRHPHSRTANSAAGRPDSPVRAVECGRGERSVTAG